MPYSNLEQIEPILQELKANKPTSILDVGCGLGLYGYLCRIYLELYGDDYNFFKKLKGELPWQIKIHGIEGYRGYLKYIPTWAYDNIIIDDAISALTKISDKQYDVTLALAIIEHFHKTEAYKFVTEMQRASKKIILSVPKQWHPQSVPGNDYETHRSHWTREELKNIGFSRFLEHPYVWIAIWQ